MKDIRTPGDPGQNPALLSPPSSSSNVAMPPDRAQIESKLIAALHLADRLARELLTARRRDEAPKDMGPPLAKRSDGALLVNADYLPGPALAGRSLWVGVVLEGSEAEGIRAGMEEASIELVSHLAAKLTTAPEGEADARIDTPPGPQGDSMTP